MKNIYQLIPVFRQMGIELCTQIEMLKSSIAQAPRHMVFFHFLRTGGSSTFKALSYAAAKQKTPVCDLYHHARYFYSDNQAVKSTMYDLQKFIRNHDCLIHHHIPFCLDPYFDQPIQYTTIVRDPVDRFISEINHFKHIIDDQSQIMCPVQELEGLGVPKPIIELLRNNTDLETLVNESLAHAYFIRYYYNSFSRLLDPEASKKPIDTLLDDQLNIEGLAKKIQSRFIYIGNFGQLTEAMHAIADAYSIQNVDTSECINKRNSKLLLPQLRNSLRDYFKEDYRLLQAIGFDFPKRV